MMLEAERAVQFCVSVAQRAQQALLRIDSGEASCSGADPVSRRPSRPLAYAPYASVGLAGHRARNCVQDLSVDDGEIHMRATQPGRPGNLSTAAWGRNPLLLDEGAEISDADEGTDGMTEEDRKKYECVAAPRCLPYLSGQPVQPVCQAVQSQLPASPAHPCSQGHMVLHTGLVVSHQHSRALRRDIHPARQLARTDSDGGFRLLATAGRA